MNKMLFPKELLVVCRTGDEKNYFYAFTEVSELNAYEDEFVAQYELIKVGKKRTEIEWE